MVHVLDEGCLNWVSFVTIFNKSIFKAGNMALKIVSK